MSPDSTYGLIVPMLPSIAASAEPTSVSSLKLTPVFYAKDNFRIFNFLFIYGISKDMGFSILK